MDFEDTDDESELADMTRAAFMLDHDEFESIEESAEDEFGAIDEFSSGSDDEVQRTDQKSQLHALLISETRVEVPAVDNTKSDEKELSIQEKIKRAMKGPARGKSRQKRKLSTTASAKSKKRQAQKKARQKLTAQVQRELFLVEHLIRFMYLSAACDDVLLQGQLVSLYKSTRQNVGISSAQDVATWCKEYFRDSGVLVGACHVAWTRARQCILDQLNAAVQHRIGGAAILPLIFITLCRGLGFMTRLIHVVQLSTVVNISSTSQFWLPLVNDVCKCNAPGSTINLTNSSHKSNSSSSTSSSKGSNKSSGYQMLRWAEVYSATEKRWMPVDCLDGRVVANKDQATVGALFNVRSAGARYVMAVRPVVRFTHVLDDEDKLGSLGNLIVSDVTPRYVPAYSAILKARRKLVNAQWFTHVLTQLSVADNKADDMKQLISNERIPSSLSKVKNHPLFVVEAHCQKYQVIYPKQGASIGVIREENKEHAVYPRANLHHVRTAQGWETEEGRKVLPQENPIKIIAAPMISRNAGQPVQLFGRWQTVPVDSTEAQSSSSIPRNNRGHVVLYRHGKYDASMLPANCAHLSAKVWPTIGAIASTLGIEHVPAMVGFTVQSGKATTKIDGIVVRSDQRELLVQAAESHMQQLEDRKEALTVARARKQWRTLVNRLINRAKFNAANADRLHELAADDDTGRREHRQQVLAGINVDGADAMEDEHVDSFDPLEGW